MVVHKRRQILRSAIISFLGMMCLLIAVRFVPAVMAQSVVQEAVQEAALPQKQVNDLNDISYFEDLVLAVYADGSKLSSGVFAIQQDGRFYLPIGAMSDVLGFSIDFDRGRRSVEGWATSKDESFTIDAATRALNYRGKTLTLPENAILNESLADDDLYLLLEVYNQIWPLDFEVNFSALVLRVIPNDLLPFQKTLKRKLRQKNLTLQQEKKEREEAETKDFPFVAMPYQLFSKPSLDVSVNTGFDANTDRPEYLFSLSGVQDLAYASADYSVSFAKRGGVFNKPDNFRLRFKRQNIHEGALPFDLEEAQWGDVSLRNRSLISTSRQGRGIVLSTRENKYANEFDLITIDGVGTPGWETELYINDQLLHFGSVDERGEYRFEDVSIGFGNNRVRVVLYGPQGQIKERNENYFYQANMVKPGENEFTAGILDAERDLIPIDVRDNSRPKGLAANVYGARGISDRLTVFASANTIKDNELTKDVSRNYLTVGAIGSVQNTLAQIELYKELGAGQALDVRTLSDFKGFKINTQTALYSNFESPDANRGDNAKTFEFDFDVKKIVSTFVGSLGLEAGFDYLKRKNDSSKKTFTFRQSLGKAGTRVTHQTKTNISNSKHTSTTGRLSSTTRKNRWLFREGLNYNIFPDLHATSAQALLRYGNPRDFTTGFRLERNFDSKETIVGLQISKDFDKFLGSVDTDWSSKFGASLMLRASASLGPYGPNGNYLMQSRTLQNVGPLSSFVYLDKDYDGLFTEGDEPVPGTKISMGRRVTKGETDEVGYLSEINPSVGAAMDIKVAKGSIDDPYIVPSTDVPGYRIYPRPGVLHSLKFPLIETGAIDGTLRWEGDREPIAGLMLQLMNSDAEIIQSSMTASDGYFTFERIPPDSYTIRADPETGFNIPFKYVDLTVDNLFQFGVDIDAVDLSRTVNSDLGIGVSDDGLLNVKNIVSIAKGFKDKRHQKVKATPITQKTINGHAKKSSSGGGMAGPAAVQAVRIGEHPDKIRVVLDLSGPTKYSLNYDPKSNSVFVEMPFATWAAKTNWQSASGKIINNYTVESVGSGVRFILGVQDGVEIGASGLLNANGGKKDRLYIDIEKK